MPGVQKPHCSALRSRNAGLQIGDLAAVGQPFDRLDRRFVCLHRQHQAGPNDLPVDAHGAGTANPMLAADMGAGQFQMLAQKIREIESRQNLRIDALAIDLERDGARGPSHDPSRREVGPESSADTQRASKTLARCRRMAGDACWSSCGSSSSPSAPEASDNSVGVIGGVDKLPRGSGQHRPLADGKESKPEIGELIMVRVIACAASPTMA